MRDPYKVLGVDKTDDADTIRKAFRKLARQYHPDVNQREGAEERFKEISQAYDVVGDEEKRRQFDTFGHTGGGAGFGGGGFPGPGGGASAVDLDDLFSSFFGERLRRGRDVRLRVHVRPDVAITGGEVEVNVPEAAGDIRRTKVQVPAGVHDGSKLRLRGQGPPPRGGGPCGDLILELQVPEHPLYSRDGEDLELEVPITVLEGLEGARIAVPTPTGAVKLTIPAGTTGSKRLRVRGRGVQKRGAVGDLYVILRPTLPEQVDDEVLEAARTIERAYGGSVRAKLERATS